MAGELQLKIFNLYYHPLSQPIELEVWLGSFGPLRTRVKYPDIPTVVPNVCLAGLLASILRFVLQFVETDDPSSVLSDAIES